MNAVDAPREAPEPEPPRPRRPANRPALLPGPTARILAALGLLGWTAPWAARGAAQVLVAATAESGPAWVRRLGRWLELCADHPVRTAAAAILVAAAVAWPRPDRRDADRSTPRPGAV